MEILVKSGAVLLPVLYTLTVMSYLGVFFAHRRGPVRWARQAMGATLVVHLAAVGARGVIDRACPVLNTADRLSLIALSILVMYWVLEWRVERRSSTGVFVLALALGAQLAASILSLDPRFQEAGTPRALNSVLVLFGVIGLSAVAVASVYGLLFLMLYSNLKRGQFGRFYQSMPDLAILSRSNYWSAVIAFGALTVATTVGTIALAEGREYNVARVVVAALLWGLYGMAVVGHRFLAMSGKRLAYSTLFGFLLATAVLVIDVLSQGAA